jgi:hypothetical protein
MCGVTKHAAMLDVLELLFFDLIQRNDNGKIVST